MEPDVNVQILGIYDFQDGIVNGQFTDAKGVARLIINGSVYNTYSVHIDRRIVSSSGAIVSFEGLLKEYGGENIQVEYIERPPKLPNLYEYMEYKKERESKGKKGKRSKK